VHGMLDMCCFDMTHKQPVCLRMLGSTGKYSPYQSYYYSCLTQRRDLTLTQLARIIHNDRQQEEVHRLLLSASINTLHAPTHVFCVKRVLAASWTPSTHSAEQASAELESGK
jgi:hypothetical protein